MISFVNQKSYKVTVLLLFIVFVVAFSLSLVLSLFVIDALVVTFVSIPTMQGSGWWSTMVTFVSCGGYVLLVQWLLFL